MRRSRRVRSLGGRWRSQTGQAIVEFIVIFPLLLLVGAAIWQWGSVLQTQIVMTNAAREGARFAAANTETAFSSPDSLASATQERVEYALEQGFGARIASGDVSDIAVCVTYTGDCNNPGSPGPGEQVTVSVTADVRILVPFIPGLSDPHPITGSAIMVLQ